MINDSALTLGADTDITYLAGVLNKPTVENYCDSPQWKTEGYWSNRVANTGDIKYPPTEQEAIEASLELLR